MNHIYLCEIKNQVDDNGNPTGGFVNGVGLVINWQNGPLGRDGDRQDPNGAFVETIISAARQRIAFYQEASGGKFACEENQYAIDLLDQALIHLDSRTKRREAAQIEGTHTPDKT